jgi:lipoprotein-anchoring transpeptidase ErfK/SrfK
VTRGAAAAGLLTVALLAGGCAGGERPTLAQGSRRTTTTVATDATLPLPAGESFVAKAVAPEVEVHRAPDPSGPARTLANPNVNREPVVFLVKQRTPGWLEVYLPGPPVEGTGWLRQDQVTLTRNEDRVIVDLSAHMVRALRGGREVLSTEAAIGRLDAPVPGGVYFLSQVLELDDPDGPYGPYVYGLSGFVNDLDLLDDGGRLVGIHGTDDPASLGRDVPRGSIRVANDAIRRLVLLVGLGTPVEIRP